MSDKATDESARAALESMSNVHALLKILTDPVKYQKAFDALADHARNAYADRGAAENESKTAVQALNAAKKIADDQAKKAFELDASTEKLAKWEADLQQRESLLKQGNEELARNVEKRETALKKREDTVSQRETAVASEEKRIEQVKAETVARLGLSK